jgi:hypothetical protein
MALPHNELTRRMTEELIKRWLDKESEGLFSERLLQELWTFHPRVACIPIIPPGQEEDPLPSSPTSESHREGFFEKRIKRVDSGGPPPRGRQKVADPLAAPDPANTVEKYRQTEAIHRAISIRPR